LPEVIAEKVMAAVDRKENREGLQDLADLRALLEEEVGGGILKVIK